MACVSIGSINVEKVEPTGHEGVPCMCANFTYEIIRESKFGGSMYTYKVCALYNKVGNEITFKELNHRERDLFSPESIDNFDSDKEN